MELITLYSLVKEIRLIPFSNKKLVSIWLVPVDAVAITFNFLAFFNTWPPRYTLVWFGFVNKQS